MTFSSRSAQVSGPAAVDTEHRDYPVCPNCGHMDYDGAYFSEDSSEQKCPSCGQTYRCQRNTTVTYTTSKPQDAHQRSGERALARNDKAARQQSGAATG